MDFGVVSIVGFGAVVIIGGVIMAAVSFFSMKETNYEYLVEQKRREINESSKEKSIRFKREQKKKPDANKKLGQLGTGKMIPVNEQQKKKMQGAKSDKKLSADTHTLIPTNSKNEERKTKIAKIKQDLEDVEMSKHKDPSLSDQLNSKQITKTEFPKTSPSVEKVINLQAVKKMSSPKVVELSKIKSDDKIVLPPKKLETSKVVDKAVKTTLNQEKSLMEIINSTSLDSKEIADLLELLNQKLEHGEWTPADAGSRRNQLSDLQKQFNEKFALQSREITLHQQKVKQLQQDISKYKEMIEQTKNDSNHIQVEMKKLVSEKHEEINKLQAQIQAMSDATSNNRNLREENEILKRTIQSNASMFADKDLFSQDLQKRLDEATRQQNDLERQLSDCHKLIAQRQVEAENAYAKHIEELKLKVHSAEGKYGQLEQEYKKVQDELQTTESKSAELINQVVMLTEASEHHSEVEKEIAETKQALEQRLHEMDANEMQKAEQLAQLQTQNKYFSKQVDQLKLEKQKLVDELQQLSANAAMLTEDHKSQQLKEKENNDTIDALMSEKKISEEKHEKLEREIEKLRKKNNDLRERNWKAMDAVASTEKSSKDKVIACKLEAEKISKSLEEHVKQELYTAFPHATASTKEFKCWVSEFLKSVKENASASTADLQSKSKKQSEELSENLKKLETLQHLLDVTLEQKKSSENEVARYKRLLTDKYKEVEKFKGILANTEIILQSLQTSVEKEENFSSGSNRDQAIAEIKTSLQEKTKLLEKATSENAILNHELSKIRDASSQKCISNRGDSVNEDQGFLIVDTEQTNELSSQQADEVAKLKERLEKEKALTKSLGTAANKLQAVLKQTQDELNREREKQKSSSHDVSDELD